MAQTRRFRAWQLLAATTALVIAAGCGLTGNHDDDSAAAPVAATADPVTEEPTPEEPTVDPTTPSPKPKKTSKAPTKKPKPKVTTPTVDPNNFQPPSCSEREGKLVSKAKAKAALNAAAAVHYWPGTAPSLVVPSDLVRSVAWHESGWQSNIVNCDGGAGLMQVMPDTVTMINGRFEKSYDVTDYKDNAKLGANYLAWATVYLGQKFFHNKFNLSTSACKSTSSWCLLNAVIVSYHSGVGAIEAAADSKVLPDQDYAYIVRSLMKSCYCDRY